MAEDAGVTEGHVPVHQRSTHFDRRPLSAITRAERTTNRHGPGPEARPGGPLPQRAGYSGRSY